MDEATRAAVCRLLNDVANSEHRLRHLNAFDALVAACGLEVEHGPGGSSVRIPPPEKAADEQKPARRKK